ncbi:MAG: radical SAM protein [Oscillospiraceae bacterium]|jgi:DNA repair photolyase|nr:radical SAM protein [Oscillospiraceae bacterium]
MHYSFYKTILSPKNGFNLYRGCTHGCIYCDARSKCYQFNHDFEDIEVKQSASEILEKQLRNKRKIGMLSTGAMCDPYMSVEKDLRLTRRCLEVIERYGFGVSLLTKSNLVLRDLDLFKRINEQARCVVQMTLTTYDEDLCRIIEPNVSTTYERFKALEIMRDNGIETGVWLCPVLPWINDFFENIKGLLDYCLKAKVKSIVWFDSGLTLREGNREYFYEQLDRHFPGLKQRYIQTYGNAYILPTPNAREINSYVLDFCLKHRIVCGVENVFNFLSVFPEKNEQLTLFD